MTNQATIFRNQSGSGFDFCAGKSTHTVVAPPAAWMTPGMSVLSKVAHDSKLLRPASPVYILSKTSPGYSSCL